MGLIGVFWVKYGYNMRREKIITTDGQGKGTIYIRNE